MNTFYKGRPITGDIRNKHSTEPFVTTKCCCCTMGTGLPGCSACLSPFHLSPQSQQPLSHQCVCLSPSLLQLVLVFCPEMPEASLCSAQNSPDLLAAVSPGRSYLISFHKSLAPWLLAFLLSRFLLQLVGWLIVFFPQRTWFPPFFSGLNSL